MEKELDPNIIKATQTSLGKYVKRPPLSEKLLKKPPFRFLHDIVTTVLKTTKFFEGLFEDDELVSDNVKDRESKIIFLNKVISVVGSTTGKTLSVKPSKIIAGQEADKTNELLQCLAHALENKLSSDEAVKKFKENGTLQQTTEKKSKETSNTVKKSNDKKPTSKSSDKLTNNKKDSNARAPTKNDNDKSNNPKLKSKDNTIKNESPPKKTTQSSNILSKKSSIEKQSSIEVSKPLKTPEVFNKNNVAETKAQIKDNEENDSSVLKKDLSQLTNQIADDIKGEHEPVTIESEPLNLNDSYTIENQLNSSLSSQDLREGINDKIPESNSLESHVEVSKESKLLEDNQKRNDEIFGDKLLRNSTEKDDTEQHSFGKINNTFSPKHQVQSNRKNSQEDATIKSPIKSANIPRPLSVRPSSSRPGAPRLRDKHENVITESENLIVGKVNIIAENAPIEEEEDSSVIIIEQAVDSSAAIQDEHEHIQLTSSNQHGHLVQQILESQKEFSQITGKTEIEWQFDAQKAREAVNREIEQLRYNIQGLSRVANPLGKLLDHIQEDVEVMRQELQQWTKTYDEVSTELAKQKTGKAPSKNTISIETIRALEEHGVQIFHIICRNMKNRSMARLNEDSVIPLRTKVKQLHADIEEKHEKINDLKVVINKNSSRIEKLLASGDVQ